jgi:hypothetical protein
MRETLMTPKSADRLVAVRVDADATIVALVARDSSRVLRVRRVPGGFAAIDDRLMELVESEVPGGLPRSSEPRVLAARSRLREAIAAARVRLLDEESTLIPVRFPGRMSFATLERDAVAEAAAPEVEAAAEAVRELADGAAIVALDGVATAPGLLDALPGSLLDADEVDTDALDALLDAAPEEGAEAPAEPEALEPEPEEPELEAEPVEPKPVASASQEDRPPAPPALVIPVASASLSRGVVLSRAWPVAAAIASILVLGGAAAALGYTTHQPARTAADRVAPTTSSTAVTPSSAAASSTAAAPTAQAAPEIPAQPGDQAGTVTRRSTTKSAPSGATAPAPGGSSTTTPSDSASPSDTPTPTDTSTPDPTPSDTGTSSPAPTASDSPSPSDSPTDGLTITIPIPIG